MAKTLIEVKHLKKYFPTPKGMLHAVDDVTFSIGEGKTMESWESPAAGNPPWDGR